MRRHHIIPRCKNDKVIARRQTSHIDDGRRCPRAEWDDPPGSPINADHPEKSVPVGDGIGTVDQGIVGDKCRVYLDRRLIGVVERNDMAIADGPAFVHGLQPVVNNA